MFKITILPHNLTIEAAEGENLLEVIHRAGIPIEAECGGRGTCESCAAIILEGKCLKGSKVVAEGVIQTCQAVVSGDITLKVSDAFKPVELVSQAIIESIPEFSLHTEHFSPLTKNIQLTVPPSSETENLSDYERISRPLPVSGNFECSLPVLQKLPGVLREKNGKVTVTLSRTENVGEIIDIRSGRLQQNYGIACDIGTTTISLSLIDLNDAKLVDTASSYNDQIQCGADVISRIIYSQKPGRLEDLQRRVISTINKLIGRLADRSDIQAVEITSAVFAGNTTMTHLLLGIDPSYIREAPYTPAVKSVPLLTANELGLAMNPDGIVLCAPAVGSYIGGDITSGILYLQSTQKLTGVNLFIDIGTNGELVIIGEDWMIGCACSAGPAFEGVGISCGMRAAKGAIDSIEIDAPKSTIDFNVIGGGKAEGICGSGLLSLLSALFKNGIIGKDGKFTDKTIAVKIVNQEGRKRFVIIAEEAQKGRKEISISERDIDNLMRAKAAIFSAARLLLIDVGLNINDIEKIYIAGGFGKSLNADDAVQIGLFPDIDREKFIYLGNTSLYGTNLALTSSDHRMQLEQIAKSMTYIDLSSEPKYMDEYTAALFLPHTDISLFPSLI